MLPVYVPVLLSSSNSSCCNLNISSSSSPTNFHFFFCLFMSSDLSSIIILISLNSYFLSSSLKICSRRSYISFVDAIVFISFLIAFDRFFWMISKANALFIFTSFCVVVFTFFGGVYPSTTDFQTPADWRNLCTFILQCVTNWYCCDGTASMMSEGSLPSC